MRILLHGFACLPAMWDAVIAALPEGLRASSVALLLPGHGDPPVIPDTTRFDEAIAAMAEQLPTPPWQLVGYSLGARVALALALQRPREVGALTLIGVHAGLQDDEARRARQLWDETQASTLEREGLGAFVEQWERLPIFQSQQQLAPALRATLHQQRRSHTAVGLAWAMRVLGLGNMPALAPGLAKAPFPITLVAGGDDAKFVTEARRIAARAPQARCVVVPDVGHNVALEAARAVAQLLAAE